MRKIFLSLLSLTALALLAGCGTSHHIPIPSNPSGGNPVGFSNSSLTGTYAFNVHGDTTDAFFAVAGTFTADGNGNITGGTRDRVDDRGRQTLDEAITGSYFVNRDGRGQIVLNGPSGRAIYRFVMESPLKASLFQDGTTDEVPFANVIIDAVGTIELQSGTPATPTGTYVFRLEGDDTGRDPYAAVGEITFTGNLSSGTIDENDAGTFTENIAATGTVSLTGTRGTATLTASSGPNTGTHNFIAYFVSPTHIELLSTDANFFLHGEAEAQSSFAASISELASDAPEQVFALAGVDTRGARVEVGRVTLNSTGDLTNAIEDISNERRVFSGVDLTGSAFTVAANGRWTANLVNSSGAPSPALVGWQVSPARSIVLTSDSATIETGTMVGQTLGIATANITGDFAERLAGFDSGIAANVERTGSLRLDGAGTFSGRYDSQDDASGLHLNVGTSGTYSSDPTLGRSTTGRIHGLPVALYTVDAQTVDFIPLVAGSIYQGALSQQAP